MQGLRALRSSYWPKYMTEASRLTYRPHRLHLHGRHDPKNLSSTRRSRCHRIELPAVVFCASPHNRRYHVRWRSRRRSSGRRLRLDGEHAGMGVCDPALLGAALDDLVAGHDDTEVHDRATAAARLSGCEVHVVLLTLLASAVRPIDEAYSLFEQIVYQIWSAKPLEPQLPPCCRLDGSWDLALSVRGLRPQHLRHTVRKGSRRFKSHRRDLPMIMREHSSRQAIAPTNDHITQPDVLTIRHTARDPNQQTKPQPVESHVEPGCDNAAASVPMSPWQMITTLWPRMLPNVYMFYSCASCSGLWCSPSSILRAAAVSCGRRQIHAMV